MDPALVSSLDGRLRGDLRFPMLGEEVVEGFTQKRLHGRAALDGELAQLPRHLGREMGRNLFDAFRP